MSKTIRIVAVIVILVVAVVLLDARFSILGGKAAGALGFDIAQDTAAGAEDATEPSN